MPKFSNYREIESFFDIDVDEFLDACSSQEKEEIIDALIEDGYLKKDCRETFESYSPSEAFYQEAIKKFNGKWNMLTKEEEETILNIAKRF